jgi:hypothetical protein
MSQIQGMTWFQQTIIQSTVYLQRFDAAAR